MKAQPQHANAQHCAFRCSSAALDFTIGLMVMVQNGVQPCEGVALPFYRHLLVQFNSFLHE